MGVTGTRAAIGERGRRRWSRRVRAVTDKPVCVGLGVSDGDQAAEVAAFADGVIVGSAFVRRAAGRRRRCRTAAGRSSELAADLADGVRRGRA